MASQPVEVHHLNRYYSDYYNNNYMMFTFAQAFSDSLHFEIIDSWSSVKGRYKGDPVANSIWESGADIGEANDWFIIQCQTEHPQLAVLGYSSLPKWEMKWQWTTRSGDFLDVSDPTGVTYPKNHLVEHYSWARFAPKGGWDMEDTTPDFNPTVPPLGGWSSSNNHRVTGSTGWHEMICADGCVIAYQRDDYGKTTHVHFVAGDVLPPSVSHMPIPRAFYGQGTVSNGVGNDGFLAEDGSWSNSGNNYETTDAADGGFAFWDQDEVRREDCYMTQRCRSLLRKQGNQHAPDMEIETFPFLVIPNTPYGARFALGHVRKGWGKGAMTYQNKTLMTGAVGWTAVFPWDGSSLVMR